MRLLCPLALALWLLHCLCLGGLAQSLEPSPPQDLASRSGESGEGAPPRRTAGVEQVKPDTYLLPDEEGRLQPMLGWTYEDFLRVWKSREAAAPIAEEPAYSLQRLECTGRMETEGFIHLQVHAEIRLHSEARVAVPLGFPQGILTAYKTVPEEDSTYLQFDQELGEHVLWTAGDGNALREVTLDILLPVTRRGNQRMLKFHAPRAAVSELTLSLAGNGIQAESLTPGTQITSANHGETTVVEARGLAETTEIVWRTGGHGREDVRSLTADSEIQVRAEQNLLSTHLTLAVQDLHGTLDRFLMRLPAGHTLVSHEVEWATLHEVKESSSEEAAGDNSSNSPSSSATYEVRLIEPQQTPLRMVLTLERPLDLQEEDGQVQLSGVEVVGAVRQQGRLHLTVGDDLRVRWHEGQRIQQIATPREMQPAAAEEVTASFEFDAADWTLPLTLALRPTEVSVEPTYQLEIGRDGVRLSATFHYSVRGTKQFDLRFALGPWELADDPQGPETTISAENAYVDDAGTMYLPLANPAEGTFQATLKLRLPDAALSGPLQFRLPECLDGRVQDGELHVTVERALEVIPQTESLLGLASTARSSASAAPPEPLDRTSQRYVVTSLPAEYTAIVRPRSRTVRSEGRVQIGAHADHVSVEQEIRLNVHHLPVNDVALQVPSVMAYHSSVQYEVDGVAVAPSFEDPPSNEKSGEARIARLVLEQPHLGSLTIRIRFQLPWPSANSGEGRPRELLVPLAVPQADSHHLVATVSNQTGDHQVQLRKPAGGYSAETSTAYPPVSPGDRTAFDLATITQSLGITARAVPSMSRRALVVERTWIQSLVGGSAIRTRSVMRFVPTSEELVLHLGSRGVQELEYIRLNHQFVSEVRISDEEVVVPAEGLPTGESCVLEIVQQGPFDEAAGGKLDVVPPRLAEARGHGLVYWQLILPRSLYALGTAEGLASASPWTLEGVYWVRTPLLTQAELEDFVGVPRTSPPAGAFNRLLFSGVELPRVLEVSLIRRSFVVLVTSGAILALALTVLYVPALQRKELALTAVIALAVAGAMYPEIAPFLVQSGTLGIALTLIAVFLKRLAGYWQWIPARPASDTAIYRQDTPSPIVQGALPPSSEPTSSARKFVPSLSDPGVHHSA